MNISEKIIRAKADYDEVYDAGKEAAQRAFWEEFQMNGNRRVYSQAFRGLSNQGHLGGWNDKTYNPIYPIICGETVGIEQPRADNMFYYNTNITDTKVDIIINSSSAQSTFNRMYKLKTLRKLVLNYIGTTWQNAFDGLYALEEINIEGVGFGKSISFPNSSKLTKTGITNLVNALSTEVTGQTLTLMLTAVNKAFETSEGLNDGSVSMEWLDLESSKPNWTIELA